MRTLITHIDGVGHALTDVSGLVSTLAKAQGELRFVASPGFNLFNLTEQAIELASPVLDYEEAARENLAWIDEAESGSAALFCEREGIEPHEREVFEHWAVSAFIADRLDALGERIDRDFASLIVWARAAQPDGSKNDIGQCPIFRRMRLGA